LRLLNYLQNSYSLKGGTINFFGKKIILLKLKDK
jgi:hypothetical protein